jgi:DtxR family transcriptional regulator, Mn-dependent transcriptional regulator
MSSNESIEMYLETVYILEKNHGHAHVVEIAERLEVSKPSVTKAMNQLKAKKMVNKEPYGSITLTEKGKKISERIHKNHQLIASFLRHSLKLDPKEADQNACRIEHILSQEMLKAIKDYLNENHIKVKE